MQAPPQAAHTGAIGALFAWLLAQATTAEPIIASICGLVGIVSGCFAIAWYWKRLKQKFDDGSPPP